MFKKFKTTKLLMFKKFKKHRKMRVQMFKRFKTRRRRLVLARHTVLMAPVFYSLSGLTRCSTHARKTKIKTKSRMFLHLPMTDGTHSIPYFLRESRGS